MLDPISVKQIILEKGKNKNGIINVKGYLTHPLLFFA